MIAERGIEIDLEKCVARDSQTGKTLQGDPALSEPWQDPAVWEMIAGGNARAVHHIESPAMTGLCKMCNVREIDGLIAIVSVIIEGQIARQRQLFGGVPAGPVHKHQNMFVGMPPATRQASSGIRNHVFSLLNQFAVM